VRTEKDLAEKVYLSLREKDKLVFLDAVELIPGKDWEEGFTLGLQNSKVIVPLISKAGLEGIRNLQAGGKDNVLYEYEMALEQMESRGLRIIPLHVAEIKADGSIVPFGDFNPTLYPDHQSKTCTTRTVRETMQMMFKLQGIECIPRLSGIQEAIKQAIESMEKP